MKSLLMAWICLTVSGAIAAADLQTVLDKHLKALGGRESITAVKSIEAFSSIRFMEIDGNTISIVKFPDRYYTRLNLGVLTEEKGFDGLTAWTTDFNGVTRRDIPEELKPMINELYLSSYSYLLEGRIPGKVDYRGDTLIDGKEYYHLAMFPEGGDSISVFINALSGRLEYRSEMVTGIKMITSYLDFRKMSGVDMPFFLEVETPGAPYEISAWVDSVHVNTDIPDTLFLIPGQSGVDFRFPESSDSIVIPFELKRNGLFVAVKVNGRGPFSFMLDSGSATTILSRDLAENLNLEITGTIPARGVGGFSSIGYGLIDSLTIDQLSWHLTRITIFDFAPLTGGTLSGLDGILGYDFFARFPILIDFDNNNLVLYDPAGSERPEFGEAVNVDIYCQIPIIEISLNGVPARLAIDLGAQMGAVIQNHSRWYKEMSDVFNESASDAEIQGIGGTMAVKTARLDSLRIGSLLIDKPTVMVVEDYAAIPFPDYIEGFLGVEILRQFNLLIDYSKGKVYFEKCREDHK